MIDMNRLNREPEYLLNVLERNLLMTGGLKNRVTPNGIIRARISPNNSGMRCVDSSDNELPIFNMHNDGANDTDSVRAYLLCYVRRATHSVSVGSAVNFMFTTTMNGCTLGVGPICADGTRKVTHSNVGGDVVAQRKATASVHGTDDSLFGVKLLEPSTYRMGVRGMNATTFGIRVSGTWKFYFQSYSSVGGGNFKLNGVFPV